MKIEEEYIVPGGVVIIFLIGLFLFVVNSAEAAEYETGRIGPYSMTQVDKVYDGDTFYGWAETFIYQTMYMKIRIRDIDTPELRGSSDCEKILARNARDYLIDMLARAKSVTINDLEYDSFGRVLASVHADKTNVAIKMINAGHARPYVKGASGGWCLQG